jgi:hypothetical protein
MPELRRLAGPRRLALMHTTFASSTLSLAAHPSHEFFTLQIVYMAHVQRSKRPWHEDLDVTPRNSREYHNFTVSDHARVIAGDVHYNTVNHRGMTLVTALRKSANRILTQDL